MLVRLVFLVTVLVVGGSAADAPEAVISNGSLRVKLYLPDVDSGFYKGARFDWGGMIGSVELAGHRFYGPWFAKVDPEVSDFAYQGDQIAASTASAAVGPAEEFQIPLGFALAKTGETFVKIGVGTLQKFDDTPYAFAKPYKIVNHGKWASKRSADSVEFTHELTDASGYGYLYSKTIRLGPEKAQLRIEHRLKNTGKLAIETVVYDHNFTIFDGTPTGDITVKVPYEIKATRAPDPKFAAVSGKEFSYVKPLKDQERLSAGLQGFGPNVSDYDFRIEDHKTGTGIRIQGDRPLENASLWSIRSVMAVEPFIRVDVEPGKEFTWTYTYTYYVLGK